MANYCFLSSWLREITNKFTIKLTTLGTTQNRINIDQKVAKFTARWPLAAPRRGFSLSASRSLGILPSPTNIFRRQDLECDIPQGENVDVKPHGRCLGRNARGRAMGHWLLFSLRTWGISKPLSLLTSVLLPPPQLRNSRFLPTLSLSLSLAIL